MRIHKDLPMLEFASAAEWRQWLEEHHEQKTAIWLMFAKKGTGVTTVHYEEARNAAIAFGWIDGLINKYDETYYLTRFSMRKPKSGWSKIKTEVVATLIEEGKMHPAGLRHVEAAKEDGRWQGAYDPPSKMQVSPDFQKALEKNPSAAEYFATLNSSNRYAFLYKIQTATSPEMRAKRIEKFITMLEAGDSFHPSA
jgi:uncharacterized protein YdeI (YjbR/CyaY-like superfamily)